MNSGIAPASASVAPGKVTSAVEQVQNGDTIYISVTDGTIEADVTGTVKEERIYGEERKL